MWAAARFIRHCGRDQLDPAPIRPGATGLAGHPLFHPTRGPSGVPGVPGRDDPQAIDSVAVVLPRSSRAFGGGRVVRAGVCFWAWAASNWAGRQ